MGTRLTLRRIILPQAMRSILPAFANQAITLIKGTAVASVIFVNELTFRAEQIVGQNFEFFTVFAAAGVLYLAMTSVVAIVQAWLERHFNLERQRSPAAATPLLRDNRAAGAHPAILATTRMPRSSCARGSANRINGVKSCEAST